MVGGRLDDAIWERAAVVVDNFTQQEPIAGEPATERTEVTKLSNSIRFNVIYRPGSDFYVTCDELKGDLPGLPEIRNRQLVVKMTYLLVR